MRKVPNGAARAGIARSPLHFQTTALFVGTAVDHDVALACDVRICTLVAAAFGEREARHADHEEEGSARISDQGSYRSSMPYAGGRDKPPCAAAASTPPPWRV